MSKQHFEWAASYVRERRTLARGYGVETVREAEEVEEAFVRMFRRFGPRFDEDRFRAACAKEK